jgi:hypothetical protein
MADLIQEKEPRAWKTTLDTLPDEFLFQTPLQSRPTFLSPSWL